MPLAGVGTPLLWAGFTLFVLALLALDLGVFHRKAHAVRLREALVWSGVWVAWRSLSTCRLPLVRLGARARVPHRLPDREGALRRQPLRLPRHLLVLRGAGGATSTACCSGASSGRWSMRGVFILAGAALLAHSTGSSTSSAPSCVLTGIKLLWHQRDGGPPRAQPGATALPPLRAGGRGVPRRALRRARGGRRYATPLLLVLVVVETTDVVFAVDSIPADLRDHPRPVHRLHLEHLRHPRPALALLPARGRSWRSSTYLKVGLGLVLASSARRWPLADLLEVPILVSLGVVATLLAGGIVGSRLFPLRGEPAREQA